MFLHLVYFAREHIQKALSLPGEESLARMSPKTFLAGGVNGNSVFGAPRCFPGLEALVAS